MSATCTHEVPTVPAHVAARAAAMVTRSLQAKTEAVRNTGLNAAARLLADAAERAEGEPTRECGAELTDGTAQGGGLWLFECEECGNDTELEADGSW